MNVALITEGATDQIVLKPIIEAMFRDEEIIFKSLQPGLDNSERQTDFGGWQMVLKTLGQANVDDLLETNDLVVVQIDTDVSQEMGFDVPQSVAGERLNPETLCAHVIARLQQLLPIGIRPEEAAKFVFAIGVQSIECWLVGVVDGRHGPKVIGNCLERLNEGLVKEKFCSRTRSIDVSSARCAIDVNNKNKGISRQIYFGLAQQIGKPKSMSRQAKLNSGFQSFLAKLESHQEKNADK